MKNENVIYRFQQQDNVHEIYIYDEIKKTGPLTGKHGSMKILKHLQSI